MKKISVLLALLVVLGLIAVACAPQTDDPQLTTTTTEAPTEPPEGVEVTVIRIYRDATENAMFTGYYRDVSYVEHRLWGDDWLDQATQLVQAFVRSIRYEGRRLIVDFVPDVERYFQGSSGAAINYNILIATLASFPDVDEIQILVDGQSDQEYDHVSFVGIITVMNHTHERMWDWDGNGGRWRQSNA